LTPKVLLLLPLFLLLHVQDVDKLRVYIIILSYFNVIDVVELVVGWLRAQKLAITVCAS
jgi:hypothetical protein